jgi:hypothetical protein
MTCGGLVKAAALFLACSCSVMLGQNLVVNGSFESGLTSWSWGQANEAGASGTCSYNAATAPGTETLTGTPGFPATDGTEIVLGSVQSTSGTASRTNCTLYQDIAIPANTTTLVLRYDIGAKDGNDGCSHTGAFIGLYSTASIPMIGAPAVAGSVSQLCTSTPAATLDTFTVTKTVTAVAGTTVRLGFINGANVNGHEVIGIDNVSLEAPPPTVTSVNPASGPPAGGNTVTITGTNFGGTTSVTFGGVAVTSFTVTSGTTITATVPAGTTGPVSVVVTTPSGSNAANTLYAYAVPTPTLGEWGMILMALLLMFCAWYKLRRRTAAVS